MKFSDIHPSLQGSPYCRFFARMDDIHMPDGDMCSKCQERIPCDTMRAFWVFSNDIGIGFGGDS